MHSVHGTRKPIPNRDSTSGANYKESAIKEVFFPPLSEMRVRGRAKRRKKRELHDLGGKCEMVWYKEMDTRYFSFLLLFFCCQVCAGGEEMR